MYTSYIFEDVGPLIKQWTINNSVFLFNFDKMMYDNNADLNLQSTLSSIKQQGYKHVVIVECHPFFNRDIEIDELYNNKNRQLKHTFDEHKLPYVFFTANWNKWQGESHNETFFPVWFFRLRDYAIRHCYKDYEFSLSRRYNFSCCNLANLRSEKLYNYIKCFKRRRDDWYLTIYDHPSLAMSNLDVSRIRGFTDEETEIWNNEVRQILKPYEYDLLNGEYLNAFSTIFAGHTDAYCNIVVEHSAEIEIASEKSFKPFIAEQIPVYVGYKGITKFIESLGFDVFTDFIDYTSYDSCESFIDRIDLMHQEIDKVYTEGKIYTFFQRPDVVKRLKKNKELFYSDQIDRLTLSYLDRLIGNQNLRS